MIYIIIFLGLFFFSIGFILTKKNAKYLLAGYNTMSEEERKKVNLHTYLPYFRNFHVFLGVSFTAIGLILYYFTNENISGIFIASYPILAYMYFIWKGAKYSYHKNKKYHKIGVYILGATLIFVLCMVYIGLQNDELQIENDQIELQGSYGEKISFAEIKEIKLVESLPKITNKLHGFAMDKSYKGIFKTQNGERVKLILNSESSPYILIIKSDNKKIYFSSKNQSNQLIYNEIIENLNKLN